MAAKKEGFETKLDQLTQISETLEKGEMTLDDMLVAFENGIKLYRECHEILEKAESKVKQIVEESTDDDVDFLMDQA